MACAAFLLGCNKSDADGEGGSATQGDSSSVDTDAPATSQLALPVAAVPVRQGDLVLTVSTTGQVASTRFRRSSPRSPPRSRAFSCVQATA